MPPMTLLAFLFLTSAFLSLWITRNPKVWGTLLGFCVFSAVIAGNITRVGLAFLVCLTLLWIFYKERPVPVLFIVIVCFTLSFKLRFLPGYLPFFITPKFAIGLENPLLGLFPLALVVPLAKNLQDWRGVLKGLLFGCAGIILLAFLATISGAVRWEFKLPSYFSARIFSHLILTSIPEEGFYRGFVQKTLSQYFKNTRVGNVVALLITSLLFSLSHIYWSPNLGILAFTFFAGLLYGGVYLFSGKIESAILCHFLLNLTHMTFFSYHAM